MVMTKKIGFAPSWSFHTEFLHTTPFTVFSVLLTLRPLKPVLSGGLGLSFQAPRPLMWIL